jgi:AraC-like DNA-binding protein
MSIYSKNRVSPAQKISKAIELLVHYNLTPVEISYQLDFNSLEEFTNQFKIIAGLTPEQFKQLRGMDNLFIRRVKAK